MIDPTVFAFDAFKKAEATFVSYPAKTRAYGTSFDQFTDAPVLSARGASLKLVEILDMEAVDGGWATRRPCTRCSLS